MTEDLDRETPLWNTRSNNQRDWTTATVKQISEEIHETLTQEKKIDQELINIVLKTRLLNQLLSWDKEERVSKQKDFFSIICKNIVNNLRWELKENAECFYILNKYKPWKYDSLRALFAENKPMWEDWLLFFIDEIIKAPRLLSWISWLNKENITKFEIIESQISRLDWDNQMKLLQQICINLNQDGTDKKNLAKTIVDLIWWRKNQDKKVRKSWRINYLMYQTEWVRKTIKLHPHIIQKISKILIEKKELEEWIICSKTWKLCINEEDKNNKENILDIPDKSKKKVRQFIFINNMQSLSKEEKIKKQKDVFRQIISFIWDENIKDISSLHNIFIDNKKTRANIQSVLWKLDRDEYPISDFSVSLIFDKVFNNQGDFEKLFNLEEKEVSNRDILYSFIASFTNSEQKIFLKWLYENICTLKEYKNIINIWKWQQISTLKNFLNPLENWFKEIYIRNMLKNVIFTDNRTIPENILELLVKKLLEDSRLFTNLIDVKTWTLIQAKPLSKKDFIKKRDELILKEEEDIKTKLLKLNNEKHELKSISDEKRSNKRIKELELLEIELKKRERKLNNFKTFILIYTINKKVKDDVAEIERNIKSDLETINHWKTIYNSWNSRKNYYRY